MNFEFSEDQEMLRDQAQKFLSEQCSPRAVRDVLEGDASYDADLWRQMGELGWLGVAIPEEFGGSGMGYLELCVIAEELGRAVAPVPFLSSVYLASEAILSAGSQEQKQSLLPELAMGGKIATLALSESGLAPGPGNITCAVKNGTLTGTKLPVPDGDIADMAVVAANDENGAIGLFLVDLTGAGVTRQTLSSVDPTRSLARIEFDAAPATRLPGLDDGWSGIARLLDRAAVLVAFEQVGGAQACLDMAREYAMDRFAFGRPIASFQAIKHKLADIYISLQIARSNAYFGAWALSTDASELAVAAATARVAGIQAFHLAAKENIQTHGGMGFTWEFDCHLYYRRSKHLALILGSERRWKNLLIDRLEMRNEA